MSRPSPPTRCEKFGTLLSGKIFQIYVEFWSTWTRPVELDVHTLRIPPVPEIILLTIRVTEDPVSQPVDEEDGSGKDWTEFLLVENKVSGLKRIHKGNPGQVTD